MVTQAAGTIDAVKNQDEIRAKENGDCRKSVSRYRQMASGSETNSFSVSGCHARGYVPSQAGLMEQKGNRIAWQEIYRRCVDETKKEKKSSRHSDKMKALRIAQKIADGKKVSSKDEEFLMQFSVVLWAAARRLALLKELDEEREASEAEEESKEEDTKEQKVEEEKTEGQKTDENPVQNPASSDSGV